MARLDQAEAVYVGGQLASAVYVGDTLVWPNELILHDDFERADPLTKWNEVQQAATGTQLATSFEQARRGSRSLKVVLEDGDLYPDGTERRQIKIPRVNDGQATPRIEPVEGDEYYFALSTKHGPWAGRDGPVAWQVILAFTSFDERGSGPLQLSAWGATAGEFTMRGVDATSQMGVDWYWMDDGAIEQNIWHDWIVHVKFSEDPEVGFFRFWHRRGGIDNDYVQQTFVDGSQKVFLATLLRPAGGPDPKCSITLGVYRDGRFTQTSVMYADELKIGTTFASVAIPAGT